MTLPACGPGERAVTFRFRALVESKPFFAGTTFILGRDHGAVRFSDLRMFVSHLVLIRADGARDQVALIPDHHQSAEVALIDFGGRAAEGPRQGHTDVRARVRHGKYIALALDLGVPFAQNHQDASRAEPPLDVSGMFWVWRDGYKFFRLDGERAGQNSQKLTVHLGSTGCKGQGSAAVDPAITCAQENRPTIRLDGFDPEKHTIDLHLDRLLSDLTLQGEQGSDGCESAPDDPDCRPVLASLGLLPGTKQRVFTVGRP